jgi:hypothetical protein
MKERWGPSLLAALLLIGGMELFFRFADQGALKAVAIASAALGVLVLGGTGWRQDQLAWKLLAGVMFTVYLVQATWRFPGLIKDSSPGDISELAILALKGLATLIVLTAIAAGAIRGLRAMASRSPGEAK